MKKIPKDQLRSLLETWGGTHTLITPVEDEGETLFRVVKDPGSVSLRRAPARISPKGGFLPQWQTMFAYHLNSDGQPEMQEQWGTDNPLLLFGAKPCGAAALKLLDLTFLGEDCPDPYYEKRRDQTTVVTVACTDPPGSCFCTWVGGSPFGKEGSDLLLIETPDVFLADPLTRKGEELLGGAPFEDARASDTEAVERLEREAVATVGEGPGLDGLPETLSGMLDHEVWDRLDFQCLGCAVCTYACPTCYCFDIQDEGPPTRGQRVRNWDSCMFPLYTKETSGHNPRSSGRERWRQRLNHKFNYFLAEFGKPSCVGCGRCVTKCPVNIDLRSLLREVAALCAGSSA
jgi:sulfhydrogenase subunit beta (sulfur reductase)